MAGLVEQAYEFADECHRGQKRVSGEPYIAHPLQTALFLVDLRLDVNTIVAALLHDVVEDCDVALDELASRFGTEVAKLVDGVTKLTKSLFEEQDHLYAESLRKMLVAMAEDIRVVLIKLADRLHNMRTLDVLPPEKRRRIAQETLDIYSPLAHRLGIWEIKWRLDDLAFFYLDEDRYHEISNMLAAKREERETYVGQVASRLREAMKVSNLTGEVVGRPKSIYSTYRKMERYAAQGKELSDIYDLYALRVLVDSKDDCYKTLGVIHQLWHPIPGQFDDYIANPKENMYQALHTTVICDGGSPLEVQIKTYELHEIAEYGVAAHWRYKEGRANDLRFEEKMTWLRQVLDWQREMAATDEFIESVKQDIFQDQVFVYTPKGAIVELTAGSTPIDFGYKIHTDLGHRCIGAKVNGRLVSLDTKLQNGDTVEVLASKLDRGPSLDWLNPNRGYVGSASARQKVRLWFRRQARSANIQRGRELLRRELRRLNQRLDDAEVLSLCNYDNMEELLANLGSGGITETQVGYRLAQARQEPLSPIVGGKPKLALSSPGSGISVLGVGDLLTRMAPCCNPIPGDSITGFVTRARGVTVHKQGCSNLANEDEPERIVHVDWGTTYELYPVRIRVTAYDRVGLLRDVTSAVSAEDVNIASVVTKEHPDGTVTMELTIYTKNLEQLGRLFAKLEGVRSIIDVTRDRSTIPLLTPN
ncbi:GTP pyrophosphokinase [Geodia barretti]|uniref:Putative GTP diphosphokinase RSH1, chloroplastic n=1 Tax=Geodia barretti TaxID=519541 RepID=A0AA35RDB2_GEOBA|nr:GTP pyrophosphokinase [Geodia barretti]